MAYISDVSFFNPTHDGTTYEASSELDKNDFLQLLVTQLQFQDPLEPMADTDFIAQLAQFSQLESLSNMSETLDTNSEISYIMSQTIANTMAPSLIGKTVVAAGSEFTLAEEESTEISFNLDASAATVTVNIYDENGDLARTIEMEDLAGGDHTIEWDGTNNSGTALAPGSYSFEVHASTAAGDEIESEERVIGVIEKVKYVDGQAYLIVGGYKVNLSTVIEVVDQGSQATTHQS